MKVYIHMILIVFVCHSYAFLPATVDLVLEPLYQDLDSNPQTVAEFGGRWIVIGALIFKKKPSALKQLGQFEIAWHGRSIDSMQASLYCKPAGRKFLPLQENLVADGTWSVSKQNIIFNLPKSVPIFCSTIWYLVLTISPDDASVIKDGTFSLIVL